MVFVLIITAAARQSGSRRTGDKEGASVCGRVREALFAQKCCSKGVTIFKMAPVEE